MRWIEGIECSKRATIREVVSAAYVILSNHNSTSCHIIWDNQILRLLSALPFERQQPHLRSQDCSGDLNIHTRLIYSQSYYSFVVFSFLCYLRSSIQLALWSIGDTSKLIAINVVAIWLTSRGKRQYEITNC